ncbi:DUF4391 domain-containing protein [Streptomyces sp. NBC_00566]|uniref:DUF4391 domain-containing protein n=1 Tax=Streptomyces sp. NBC_00566 TaxID=2975778 RepID=UPI002E80C81C|nr:DUF4391 domain-containing protein [Streptomyces sp. NBC_00566]WUB87611.1 DUF4391 domain-containing protein [Streptomyces sp. NBC_00566]
MTPDDVVDALRLPADCAVDIRVPKTQLQAHSDFSAADRRLLQDGIDTLQWAAAIRPDAVGIPAYAAPDGSRRVPELHVMTLRARTGTKLTRLEELLHRAVPYPILLISEQESGPRVSVALKRMSYARNDDVTLDNPPVTASVGDVPAPVGDAFMSTLQLDQQPRSDLSTVYEGWLARTVALRVAAATGEFTLAATLDSAKTQLAALTESSRLEAEINKLVAQIKKEKQIPRRIELQDQIKVKRIALSAAHDKLRLTQ